MSPSATLKGEPLEQLSRRRGVTRTELLRVLYWWAFHPGGEWLRTGRNGKPYGLATIRRNWARYRDDSADDMPGFDPECPPLGPLEVEAAAGSPGEQAWAELEQHPQWSRGVQPAFRPEQIAPHRRPLDDDPVEAERRLGAIRAAGGWRAWVAAREGHPLDRQRFRDAFVAHYPQPGA